MPTSNAADCTNSLLKDKRVLPIVKQFEEIRAKLMEFYQKCHFQSESVTTRVTSYAEQILRQEMEEARKVHAHVAGLVEFKVQSAEYVNVVDLERKTCTCCKWDILGLSCCHTLASMNVRNYDPYGFCEHWYLSSIYSTTYNEVQHATQDSKQWEHTIPIRVLPHEQLNNQGLKNKNKKNSEG